MGILKASSRMFSHAIVGVTVLGTLFFSAPAAHAEVLNSCATYCHGMPPRDTTARKANLHFNSQSSAFPGNHQTHVKAAPVAGDCSVCHSPVAPTDFGHQNGVIAMANSLKGYSSAKLRAKYDKGVFFNQTSIPNLTNATCSNVNCHFENKTPAWGSTAFTSPGNCSSCHGAPPSGAATGTAGSHARHDAYFSGATNCLKCHPSYSAFSHATSAGRPLKVQGYLRDPQNNLEATGSYSGTGTNYLPSQSASQVFGTCSNLYCHSTGQSTTGAGAGTTVTTPTWGSGSLTCGSCHQNMGPTANPSATGSHVKHAQTAGLGCNLCHGASYTSTSVPTGAGTTHVDKNINLGFTGEAAGTAYTKGTSFAAGSAAYGSCATSYCHSTVQGTTGTGAGTAATTPNWGTNGTLTCGSCHADMSSSATATGSHVKHAQAATSNIGCSVCHGTGYSATSVAYPSHVNQFINVTSTSFHYGKGTSFAPGAAYGSCATSYCHSNGQTPPTYVVRTWGSGPLPANCTGCHDTKRTSLTPITLSGRHDRHMNYSTNTTLGRGNGFNCVACHAKTVSSNTTISNPALHDNRLIDYSGAKAGGSAKYSTTTKLCTNIYCHSNGNPGAIVYQNPAAWNSTTTYGCNGCHGTSNATTGAPDYANGGAGTTTANSHPKHVSGAGITDTRGCANCHVKTVSQAVAGAFKDYTASNYHLNGTPNVAFKQIGASTGTWNGSTCSNTYCHGTAATVPWGSPSLACNACHGATSALPGAHGIHYASTVLPSKYSNLSGNVSATTAYRFTCSSCHASGIGKATHAGGPANANGAGEVFFGVTTATLKGSYTYGTTQGADNGFNWTNGGAGCTTSYCHSNGQGGSGLAAVSWSTTASSGTCVQCHDTKQTGATATKLSGKHDAHMNPTTNVSLGLANGFNCKECHAKTITDAGNLIIADKSKHINKLVDYSGARAGGSARYNGSTKQCSNIYCHSNGNPGAIVYVNPAAWNSTTTYGCNGCHGTTSAIGAPDYANGGPVPSTTANSHAKHVAGAADTTVCATCHAKTANQTVGAKFKDYTAASYHLNGTPNVFFNSAKAGATATWNQATGTCTNVSCHGGTGSSVTWGATVNCQDCHGNAATASVADFGATFWNNGTMSKFQMTGTGSWAGNGHGLATGTYPGSGNPAANFGVVTNQCEFCHDSTVGHYLSSNPFRLRNYSTAAYGRNAPCLACHSATGAGVTIGTTTKKRTTSKAIEADHYGTKHTTALNGGQFCWDCHDPHGTGLNSSSTANQYMVRNKPAQVSDRTTSAPTTQTATAVVFTLSATPTGTDYAKSATPFTGICNVCHTTTSHYTQTSGDSHNSTTRCTSCHGHTGSTHGSDAFKPTGHSVPYYTHNADVRANGNTTCLGCHVTGTAASVYPATPAGTAPNCMGCHKKAAPITSGTTAGANCSSCHGVSTATTANYGRPVGTAFPDRQGYHGGAQDSAHGTAVCSTCHSGLGTSSGSGSGVNHGPGNRGTNPNLVGPMVNGITPTNGTKGVANTPVTCVHGTINSGCSGGGTQSGW